jgi:hypothetical protein
MNSRTLALAAAAALVLAGCQKASETTLEKTIESQMKAGGAKDAKVDLSGGGVKTTVTDKAGKTQTIEIGHAPVTEADLGVPLYPGAKVNAEHAMKVDAGDGSTMASLQLESTDSADKVADFYRAQLKSMAGGRELTDMRTGDAHVLSLSDPSGAETIQVAVSAGQGGAPATVLLSVHRRKRG